ncbi:MAG: hypothetical protein GX777_07650 [Fastidiosipila sp.]|nr:hypothetical protein [Fastidiosipila sp.]
MIDSKKYILICNRGWSNKKETRLFLIDQGIHIAGILITAILISQLAGEKKPPAGLLESSTMKIGEEGYPGAGSLIGILERLIILIMLSQNQYAAIGFVLTAKSIARYSKLAENKIFAEYYLLGTLLSITAVILTYLLIFV